MKRMKIILLKIFILPYIILIVHLAFNYQAIKLDGLDAEVWRFYADEETEYSDKFSHKKFASIEYGMTEKQVCEMLGEPLRKFPLTSTPTNRTGSFWVFAFSIPVDSKSYRIRFVYMENGIAVETRHEMYYD